MKTKMKQLHFADGNLMSFQYSHLNMKTFKPPEQVTEVEELS